MTYIKIARNIYEKLQETDFHNLIKNGQTNYEEFRLLVWEKFKVDALIKAYQHDTNSILEKYLSFYKDDLNHFLKSEEIAFYKTHMPIRTAFYYFWIWDKNLELSDENLFAFMESYYLGTLGYKMIDVLSDGQNVNTEMLFVGNYSIKVAEMLLAKVLGNKNTCETILKNFKIYTDVECIEKKNRWQETPYSWDEVEKLGYKSAVIYMIYETLFRTANYDEQKIHDLMIAFNYTAAALQIVDDLMDVKEDLSNGYETLVMSGYYKEFGIRSEVTQEKIAVILDQKRLKKIYTIIQELFDKARKIFENHDEYIILLTYELQFFNINSIIEIYQD